MTIDDRSVSISSNSIGSNSAPERTGATGHHHRHHSSGNVASTSDPTDSASSSGFAALISATLNAGSQDSTTRTEQLRQMVASGQYQIDTQALSRSVVDSMLKGY